ncbi:MAG: hypothetical protein B7Z66_04855 [Chromatiales bacterium 21-64-14]|nr:MAG: hypothetical protein B7Z66_04855 [Chromatiales bacterium 21-64-14]HQU14658.1 GGDEF domain-containing protein [Gammaproteobacteria bacterium]
MPRSNSLLRAGLRTLGVGWATVLLTAISILLSNLITLAIAWGAGSASDHTTFVTATVASGLITPLFSYLLLSLVSQLDAAERQLRELSTIDSLTQVYNRRRILQLAEAELARAARTGEALSVAILDIDHFKQINDTHGHPGGDVVLQKLAFLCKRHCREIDHFGRYGGEEFMFVLPTADPHRAADFAERIRGILESTAITYHDAIIPLTVSIGIASFADEELDMLLLRADQALYAAKRGGRNTTVAASAA